MNKYDLLIINTKILSLAAEPPDIIHSGYIAIHQGKIKKLGPMTDLPSTSGASFPAKTVLDAKDTLAMPGLINTHNHAAMSLFRGLADDLPLMTWLTEHIFPAEARCVNPEMVYWCTKLSAAEMLLSGTTTVADGYFHEEAAAEAFVEAGMRAVAAQAVIDYPAPGVPDPKKNIETAALYAGEWQGKNELVTPALFCHSPYTCSPSTLQNSKKITQQLGLHYFIHLAETKGEVDQIKKQYGITPIRHLDQLGILDENTVLVHCVWLNEEDIQIAAQTGAKITLCPESNMKLASGIAPVKEILAKNISVGLGTDSCASNNDLDLFVEMDTFAKLHKVHLSDPTFLPARQVMTLATRGGAKVLGLENRIGTLAPGKQADIILIDLDQPHLTPFYNANLLVYATRGADVSTVIINGRLIMKNRRILTFDMKETMSKVREMADKIMP